MAQGLDIFLICDLNYVSAWEQFCTHHMLKHMQKMENKF